MTDNTFIHSKACVESDYIGKNTRIWANTHVMDGASIGSGCNLGENVFVETGVIIGSGVTIKNGVSIWSGVTIEDDVFVGPDVVFTNDICPRACIKRPQEEYMVPTTVKQGASLGANSTVICGNEIGQYAFVGAGAVVVKSVKPFELVLGNPARPAGYVCICGKRLADDLQCSCGRGYIKSGEGLRFV